MCDTLKTSHKFIYYIRATRNKKRFKKHKQNAHKPYANALKDMKQKSIKTNFIKFHLYLIFFIYIFLLNLFFIYLFFFLFFCLCAFWSNVIQPPARVRTVFRGIGHSNFFPTSFRISFALKLSLAKSALLLLLLFSVFQISILCIYKFPAPSFNGWFLWEFALCFMSSAKQSQVEIILFWSKTVVLL